MDTIYLDNNATTRPTPGVMDAVAEGLRDGWQNPSSVHRGGQEARARVELARQALADLIGARARDITFTGSGTESIDLAIRGVLGAGRTALITDRAEHNAVRDLAEALEASGTDVRWAPIDGRGVVDAEGVRAVLADLGSSAIVSVQWANNETGAVQPIEAIGAVCREAGAVFHCDGTQWIGKEPVNVKDQPPFDLLSFSPHKFHGPKGVGVLWRARGVRLRPVVHGTQELGARGGTENTPGLLGAGAAAREAAAWLADDHARARLSTERDRLERGVIDACAAFGMTVAINGAGAEDGRLWNTTNLGFPRLEAEALLLLLSERGLAASAGAACSSGSLDPSPVLLAMGIAPEVAHGSVRFSLSRETTPGEIDRALEIIPEAVQRLAGSMARLGS